MIQALEKAFPGRDRGHVIGGRAPEHGEQTHTVNRQACRRPSRQGEEGHHHHADDRAEPNSKPGHVNDVICDTLARCERKVRALTLAHLAKDGCP